MERATSLGQQRRSYVRADHQDRYAALQAFQERHQREQVPRTCRSKNSGHASTCTRECICSKAGSLLVANHPVTKLRAAPQTFVESNVVNAGNAKTTGDPATEKRLNHRLRAGSGGNFGRGLGDGGHFELEDADGRTGELSTPPVRKKVQGRRSRPAA